MAKRLLHVFGCISSIIVASCGSFQPPPAAAAPTATTQGAEAPAACAPAEPQRASESTARAVLHEVQAWVNGATLDEATYNKRFVDSFIANVPYARLAAVLASLRGQEPWHDVSAEEDTKVVAHWARADQKLRVTLVPDSQDARRIASLLFAPDTNEHAGGAQPKSGKLIEQLRAMGTFSLLVANTTRGKCEPLAQLQPELTQPLGSAFKLWVLAAVVKKVNAGELHWTDPVTIYDALDSLPSGVTQDDPDGSTRSVRELAERMIAISDNTATDHLIMRVGRGAVEKALIETGHAHPALDRPFLTTREMMILKFGADEAEYLTANEAGRRKLLEVRVRAAPLPQLDAVNRQLAAGPTLIGEIEWLGSTLDLCRVLVTLTKDEAASKILGLNPGIAAPPGRWSYVAYKGGSEAGVLAMAWEHEAASGERYVTAAALSNNNALLPEHQVVQLMAAIRDAVPKVEEIDKPQAPQPAAP